MKTLRAYIKWLRTFGFSTVDWDDVIGSGMGNTARVLNSAGYLPYTKDDPMVQLRFTKLRYSR